jgi:hypothetical protein
MCNHIHRRGLLAAAGGVLVGLTQRALAQGASEQQLLPVKPILAASTAQRIAAAAHALIAELRPELRAKLQFAFNDPERKDWHNFPNMIHPRKGVRLGEMTDSEKKAAHNLMQTMLSGDGYLKVTGIMFHDEVFNDSALKAPAPPPPAGGATPSGPPSSSRFTPEQLAAARNLGNGGGNFGATLYFVDVFGNVGTKEPWGVQLDGHHLAINLAVIDNREITITPTFLGSEPALIQSGTYAGAELFGRETRMALELRNSLTPDQLKKATLAEEVPSDIFTGPERDVQLNQFQGVSGLQGNQRDLAEWLIEEYIGTATPDVARGYREAVRNAGLDKIHFAWIGPADLSKELYFRLHSPAILIELEKQRSLQRASGPANHIHSIMRTPGNDYGVDWMRQHHLDFDHSHHY